MKRFTKKFHLVMEIFWPAIIVMMAFVLIMAKPHTKNEKKQVSKETAGYNVKEIH